MTQCAAPHLPADTLLALLLALPCLLVLCSTAQGAAHVTEAEGSVGGLVECPTCPYFLPTPRRVTTPLGIPANLTCGVRHLGDRKVSWIRRRDLHVLTTGNFTYTTDKRFRALHLDGSPFWTLQVKRPTVADSGLYECQLSTQPKKSIRFTLSVVVPTAAIGSREIFMKAGSDLNITCTVQGNIRGAPVTWYHVLPRALSKHRGGQTEVVEEVNAGGRGGVQLVTDKNSGTSWLLVKHATWRDAGNYTCAPVHATSASVSVHVLDEEAPAELHHDPLPSRGCLRRAAPLALLLMLVQLLLRGAAPRPWMLCCLLALCCLLPTAHAEAATWRPPPAPHCPLV